MEEKVIEKSEELIDQILDEGINANNIEHLYKLSKINHIAKEDKKMYGYYGNYGENYGNYGRGAGYDSYGRYGNYGNYGEGSYGRRGRDAKYRGEEEIDRMSDEYGRYQENRNRYGASEETDKSFHYMIKALEDFIKVLYEEADTPQQKQELMQTLQSSMR